MGALGIKTFRLDDLAIHYLNFERDIKGNGILWKNQLLTHADGPGMNSSFKIHIKSSFFVPQRFAPT